MKPRYPDLKIINAGVSGDTAADGLARLDWALTDEVGGLIVELGANDALRGLDVGADGNGTGWHHGESAVKEIAGAHSGDESAAQYGAGLCGAV